MKSTAKSVTLGKILLGEPLVPLLTHSNGCRCYKNIRYMYVESGFMGHLNYAKTFGIMRRIVTELCFLEQCMSLGETFYPNGKCKLQRPNCSAVSTKIGQNETKM